jgi:hypothetical protein
MQGGAASSHQLAQQLPQCKHDEVLSPTQGQTMPPSYAQSSDALAMYTMEDQTLQRADDTQLQAATVVPGGIPESMSASLHSLAARMQQLTGRAGLVFSEVASSFKPSGRLLQFSCC